MRGIRELFRKLEDAWGAKTLKPIPMWTKGKKGVPNQCGH
jgi:hypothetical protein